MIDNQSEFDRRTYLRATGAATAGMIGLAGCTGDQETAGSGDDGTDGDSDEPQYGTLSTAVTDQPNDIDDFESLVVTMDGLWIKPADDENGEEAADDEETDDGNDGTGDEEAGEEEETDNESEDDGEENDDDDGEENDGDDGGENDDDNEEESDDDDGEENDGDDAEESNGDDDEDEAESNDEDSDGSDGNSGRYYIEFEEPQEADLVQLQGGNTQLVDETEVETGDYQFLQLDVSDTEGILEADGSEADVVTPGNAPLMFNAAFEIRPEERTRFIADFAPHRTGQGRYIIRPVASGTQVLYGDEEYDPENGNGEESDDVDEDDDGEESGGGGGGAGQGGNARDNAGN